MNRYYTAGVIFHNMILGLAYLGEVLLSSRALLSISFI